MDKNLTIGDIAQALGVSKTTVSRAISGKGRIGEETRKKVLDYIETHHYRPNVVAKGLAQNKTYNLGLVLPGDYHLVDLPFFQKCMLGISKAASEKDYDVLITMVSNDRIGQLKRAVTNHKIDGAILTRTLVDDRPMQYLQEKGVPFVAIGSTEDNVAIQIDNDHRTACKTLTEKLLGQGIRRIALIGDDENYMVTKNRLLGFEDAFKNRPNESVGRRIFLNVTHADMVDGIVEELLSEDADCIVTMDDFLCSRVLNALQRRGVDVPGQMQVASFYDSVFLAEHMPQVSSIWFDVEELGRKACELLLQILAGESVEQRTLLGYQVRM